MIFKPELAEKILKGEKTQTRRIVKPGEWLVELDSGTEKIVFREPATPKWVTGHTYAIQPGRTKAGIGRLKLLDIRRERLGDISEADAIAEGVERNCEGVPLVCPACCYDGKCQAEGEYIHYLRGEDGPPAYSPAESFLSLFESINGPGLEDKEVWVLVFEAVKDEQK